MSWNSSKDNQRNRKRQAGPSIQKGKRGKREALPVPDGIDVDVVSDDSGALPSLAEAMAWDRWYDDTVPLRQTLDEERLLREQGMPSSREMDYWSRLLRRDIHALW